MATMTCGWCSTGHHETCRVAFEAQGVISVCSCPCDKTKATPVGPVPENYTNAAATKASEPDPAPRKRRRKSGS